MQLTEDEFGSLDNARFLAKAADLAYLGQTEGEAAYQQQLGLLGKLYSVDNTQAWIVGNDEHLVVAFRGTESPTSLEGLKDWLLTDALNLLILPQGRLGTDLAAAGVAARFHQGFVDAIAEVWPPLIEGVQQELAKRDRPLWITGHSLGGALATLAAWLFHRKFISVHQVYTFGAPMIGNRIACSAIDHEFQGKFFRYVNPNDPVPLLPTMSLLANDFSHCEKEICLGNDGSVRSAAALLTSFASAAVDGIVNRSLADKIWGELQKRVVAHLMPNYHTLLDEAT